jgi:AraC-like DNA-binding protein
MNAQTATANPHVPSLRFSSDAFAPHERVDAWRESFGREILKLEVDALSDGEFRSEVTLRMLPGLVIMTGDTSAIRFNRPRHLIDSDDIGMSISLSGDSLFCVRERAETIHSGDAAVMGAGAGGMNETRGRCRFVGVRMSRKALGPLATPVTELLGRRIPAATPALRLLRQYLGIVLDTDALETPELQHHAATHIQDLFQLTLGATRDAAHIAEGRGLAAARLRAIKQDIARNLAGDLSAGAIALRHQLTPRAIQKLFEAEGTTLSEFVLATRLTHAHRMLSDPARAAEKIITVAFAAGFGDMSYFYRAFRRRYGALPTDVRAQAQNASRS